MYEYVDKVLKKLVKAQQVLFQNFRELPYDELNVVSQVRELYAKANELNEQAFSSIFRVYYQRESNLPLTDAAVEAWLAGVLGSANPVMGYVYDAEIDRKRDRLAEALIASKGDPQEIDKAMRYWVQMSGWFAVAVADAAMLQARMDEGVEYVIWVTQHDGHVCAECASRDGEVYHTELTPPKPHPNCRCYTIKVIEW